MATLDNRVFDNGLTVLDTEANAIHITSAEATSFANVASVTLGNSTSLSIARSLAQAQLLTTLSWTPITAACLPRLP
jgi:hypothetical protein